MAKATILSDLIAKRDETRLKLVNGTGKTFIKKEESDLITDRYDLSKLTKKEELYFRMMFPKAGVLFLMSPPGMAKSAIVRSIAKKLDLNFIDIRLSMIDETDIGLYPNIIEVDVVVKDVFGNVEYINDKEGKKVEKTEKKKFLSHVTPYWAQKANEKGTIIHFEELNRAPLSVRNAALQILLERCIGYDFEFNKDVFMVASGNLGDADGTDVEELDSAIMGRLIPWKHRMSFEEWRNDWAEDNIHPAVLSFLAVNEEYFNVQRGNETDSTVVLPTPRNWTFLSQMIERNFGMDTPISQALPFLRKTVKSYIGKCSLEFLTYCDDIDKITIKDVVESYSTFKERKIVLKEYKRRELLHKMKQIDITKLSEMEISNVKLFLLDIRADELVGFLFSTLNKIDNEEYLHNSDNENNDAIFEFLEDERFREILETVFSKFDC